MDYEGFNQSVPISRIEFQVLTNKQVKSMSVVRQDIHGINQTDTQTDGQATRGGLLDPRLGTTELGILCATCGQNNNKCYGHSGHTDLAEPVFHFGYLDIVKSVLSCICLNCSKLLIYKNEEEMNEILKSNKRGKNRFAEVKKLTSNISYCARTEQNCGVPVSKIKKDVKKGSGIIQIVAETNVQSSGSEEGPAQSSDKKKIRKILTPRMVYDILKNVSDEDYYIMGFDPSKCRPEDFIIKVFLIPPIAIRPSVKMSLSSSTNYEDMLIGKLVDIIKTNIRIRKQLDKEISGEEPKYLDLNIQLLQYHIATYFDNENMSLPKSEQKSGGKPTKSISDRIRGKTGRIRGNLMGKRVDFSARTVITSDPNLSLDELGVPIKIAMNITFPEVVTLYNIDEMNKLVKNGRFIYPGANNIKPYHMNDSKRHLIDLRYRKKGIKLRPGDIVERHIKDGDAVLFNRQPSLHKLSMMSHRVKVINDDRLATFRINVTVTTPYNADFDGDEMNMFVPQQIQTQMELTQIANASLHIITPRTSGTIIKLKQDAVVGSYLITDKNVNVPWKEVMNILMNCTNIDSQLKKIKKVDINTHKLFSTILPQSINYIDGDKIEIKNSELIKGIVNGNILNDSIIGNSWDRHGPKQTKDFIDNIQRLVVNYFLTRGFTTGLSDAMTTTAENADVRKYLEEKMLEVQHLITEIENFPDLIDAETFEEQIYSLLMVVRSEVAKKIMKKSNSSNNFYAMIASKSKGSDINLGQIVGGNGQDILQFKRIQKKVNGRSIVHFCQNDDTAAGRGFLVGSFFSGLEPHEFYFHHMAGREGLIDTAIKSVTGDTKLVIIENGKTKLVNIGDWIDALLVNNSDIQLDDDRELLRLNNDVYIPTTDLDGKVSWGQITAITRHNPSAVLYKIKTESGREVIVTDSHSLLIWNEETSTLVRLEPFKIDVGAYVPLTLNLNEPPTINKNNNMQTKYDGKLIGSYLAQFNSKEDLININIEDFINAPNEFIDGLIEGIFHNRNNISSSNLQFIEIINICLSRQYSFATISENYIGYKLELPSKFKKYNDIVLDKIVEINKIDSKTSKYSKVYDLTIPSTLNFGLANGLHVVDTSDSGYLQRKLIKGMEDVYIAYDGTVRSGNNVMIQMLFADSHMDQAMQKKVKFHILSWGNKKIEEVCHFTSEQLTELNKNLKYDEKSNKALKEFNDEIVDTMKQFRDDFRNLQRKSKVTNATLMEIYFQPVNYSRIIDDAKNAIIIDNSPLDPLYIISEIERLMDPRVCQLVCTIDKDIQTNSPKMYNQKKSKYLFQIALYEFLSPKRCIYEYKFTKEKFDQVIAEIIRSFNISMVEPGEMVGVVASQSLGEPLTNVVSESL